jgi:ABC-type transport system substrate-binding protein
MSDLFGNFDGLLFGRISPPPQPEEAPMKTRTAVPVYFFMILAVASLACQLVSAPRPSDPTGETPSEAASTPRAKPTRADTSTPEPASPLEEPTAAPEGATPAVEDISPTALPENMQLYRESEMGVSVVYPTNWELFPPDADQQGILTYMGSTDGRVMGLVFATQYVTADALETVAADLSVSFLGSDVETEVSEGFSLSDGRLAWYTVAVIEDNNGSSMMVHMITTLRGARLVSLVIYGEPSALEKAADTIETMRASLHVESGQIYGIPRDQALVLSGGESTNPREYDPATTHSSGDKRIFSGLVSFDPELHLTPELAERWEVTDGVVYTFHLRRNAKFHDGRPVTAADVIYSWERAADPAIESDTVLTYLGDIVGVREVRAGEAQKISGLKALDDYTLQVTIDAPKPYFLLKLTYATAFVLDRSNVESGPEWYRTPNGTGPYKLTRWDSFEVMIYERNDDFYIEPPAIPYIVIPLFSGVDVRLYEMGEADMAGVSYFDVPRFTDPNEPLHAELHTGVNMCTSYITFDTSQPPFDDVKVRQAFSMAFDRQKYMEVVLQGIGIPAKGVFPPSMPGYNTDLQALPFDPQAAQQLLAESRYGGVEGLPAIVYTDGGWGSDVSSSAAALAQMWQQTLGVTITIENLEPNFYYDKISAGEHGQIFDSGWCADYPDPENFADVLFHSEAEHNNGNYSNPDVDALLEAARIEPDPARRIALYQQAEQQIVADAPAIFTVHGLSYVLVKPYIQGYTWLPISIPLERYLWIDPSKIK